MCFCQDVFDGAFEVLHIFLSKLDQKNRYREQGKICFKNKIVENSDFPFSRE